MTMALGLRPAVDENAAAWTEAVFAAGDYAGVAMFGSASVWQYYAARALILGEPAALAALAGFGHAEARLYRGAALWIHGETAAARRELAGSPLAHAQRLLALIEQPRIRVLAQLPWVADACTDLLGGAQHDPHFEVRNIGYREVDAENHPYADVGHFLDSTFTPDFYITAMAEWHHVPPNLQTLPCPTFAHIADHDLHIQTLSPWLSLFDEVLVTDRTEWLDVQGLARGLVSSFPKVFGLPTNLPPVPCGERPLDFFVSGTMLDRYHPDKAVLLHELLSMPDIDLRVVRGATGTMAYHSMLGASKTSFTYVRRAGAMPTRGLESLALGCAVALQEESILNLFVGRREGVVTYGPQTGSLSGAVRGILDAWPEFERAAQRGAEFIRAEFALPRVASQYLRFLTFRAAAPRRPRQRVDSSHWCQKRVCIHRTWLPDSPVVRRRTMQANFLRLGAVAKVMPKAAVVVDMARELLTEFVHYKNKKSVSPEDEVLLSDALGLLEKACRIFPRHLVARFVWIRTLLHYGDARQRMQGLQLAFDTMEADPQQWEVDARDDVLPFDFHWDEFNYRDYLDLVARAEKGQFVPTSEYVRILLASLAGYVARKTGKPEQHERAAHWDPGFARYRLDWAKALLKRGGASGRQKALALLVELAAGTTEFEGAGKLLERVANDSGVFTATHRLVQQRLAEHTIDTRIVVPKLFEIERRAGLAAQQCGAAQVVPTSGGPLRVSVAIAEPGSERELAALLTDLDNQSQTGMEVLVALAPAQQGHLARIANARSRTGARVTQVRSVAVAAGASFYERLNACLAAAAAPLVTLAMPGDRFRVEALERLCREFEDDPAIGVVFASEGWTATAIAHFVPAACVAFSCRAPFGLQRMISTNAIGMHPVWRRDLHDQHGWLDPRLHSAAEYEFWLRVTPKWRVRQIGTLLSVSALDAPWRALRDPRVDIAAALRARALHVDPAVSSQPFQPHRALPASLFATGLPEEAASHARLGILTEVQQRDVSALAEFYGTALLHGDPAVARCLLATVRSSVPGLLSAHLAQAQLLDALSLPGAVAALEAGRDCEPYTEFVARLLAARRVANRPARGAAHVDTHQPEEEPEPCPT
ncbi:MAG: hypothetical protein IT456_14395 [Planctomycetes bacterium]|nr:hypothetical protein [Planctomycetota bacterium]